MALQWLPSFRSGPVSHTAGLRAAPLPGKDATADVAQAGSKLGTTGHQPQRPRTLMGLPPEIHLQISQQLIYPDALSLKHTSRYFYRLVDTGVKLKVDWLMSRRQLHLDCPNDTRCDLGSDLRFCRGSVPYVLLATCWCTVPSSTPLLLTAAPSLLMKRRREHIECESRPDLGCLIYGTSTCVHRRPLLQRWFRQRLTVEMWWVVLALLPLVLSWLWFAELLFFAKEL